ncbi:MAG: V-type ATP synthase subunit E family protein, partial [bacterium]|nr:V-type ATP synthase subunit E family protein [bacterium]
ELPPALARALAGQGVTSLYSHQAQALNLARAGREAEAARQRVVTAARLQARALLAQARRDVLEEVFRSARETLADLPGYRQRLLEALVAVAGGTETVVLSPRDQSLGPWLIEEANRKLGGSLVLAGETRPLAGGFVLLAGPVEINVSLDVELEGLRDDLEPEVAGVLFGEG